MGAWLEDSEALIWRETRRVRDGSASLYGFLSSGGWCRDRNRGDQGARYLGDHTPDGHKGAVAPRPLDQRKEGVSHDVEGGVAWPNDHPNFGGDRDHQA